MSHPDFRPETYFRPEALTVLRPRDGRAQGIYRPSLGRTQAAAHCDAQLPGGMSIATFDRYRQRGEIPSHDENGDLRFLIEDLDTFCALRREAQEQAEREAYARREAERLEAEGEIKSTPELAQAREKAKRAAAEVRATETEIPRLRREAARLQQEATNGSDTDPVKIVARESRIVEIDKKLIPAQERALHARREAATKADAELQKALAQARGVARIERAAMAHTEAETAAVVEAVRQLRGHVFAMQGPARRETHETNQALRRIAERIVDALNHYYVPEPTPAFLALIEAAAAEPAQEPEPARRKRA